MAKRLTDADKLFIENNYLQLTNQEMADYCGTAKSTVSRWVVVKKLKRPPDVLKESRKKALNARYAKRTHPEDAFITANYLTINVNQLAIHVGRSETFVKTRLKTLGLVIPPEVIEQRKLDSRIQPGTKPFNKGMKQTEFMSPDAIARTKDTRFRSGQRVHNEGQDGDIRIRNSDSRREDGRPLKYIRLAKGKWKELHILLYEEKHGPVPPKHVLACKDGNTLNADPDNWFVLSKAENAKRNQNYEKRSETMKQLYLADKIRNPFRDASDSAVANWLFKGNPELQKEALNHPELIQLKRSQILHKRAINEGKNNQNGESDAQ